VLTRVRRRWGAQVLAGALGALWVMTALSAAMGWAAPALVRARLARTQNLIRVTSVTPRTPTSARRRTAASTPITHAVRLTARVCVRPRAPQISPALTHHAATALFFFFGLRTLYQSVLAWEGGDELAEVRARRVCGLRAVRSEDGITRGRCCARTVFGACGGRFACAVCACAEAHARVHVRRQVEAELSGGAEETKGGAKDKRKAAKRPAGGASRHHPSPLARRSHSLSRRTALRRCAAPRPPGPAAPRQRQASRRACARPRARMPLPPPAIQLHPSSLTHANPASTRASSARAFLTPLAAWLRARRAAVARAG
jgi:hypothetical protein